jgi:hypothetical protein
MTLENVHYAIIEKNEQNTSDVSTIELLKDMNHIVDMELNNNSAQYELHADQLDLHDADIDAYARELDFSINNNVSELRRIMDYYEIPKRRMKKNEMIEELILFEQDISNIDVVSHRRYLWDSINELKADPFMSKYISF